MYLLSNSVSVRCASAHITRGKWVFILSSTPHTQEAQMFITYPLHAHVPVSIIHSSKIAVRVMASYGLQLIYILTTKYKLSVRFWLKLFLASALSGFAYAVYLVHFYFGREAASTFALSIIAIAVFYFLRWPGVLTPSMPNLLRKSNECDKEYVRIVAVSDTHNKTHPGTCRWLILLHYGDFTLSGTKDQAKHFNDWLGTCADLENCDRW